MPAAPNLSCAVDSFVRLSPRDGLQATVGGGRYKVPAPPGATPAAAIVANPVTAEAVVTAFTAASGLFAGWFAVRAVQKLKTNTGNVIVVTNDAAGEAPPPSCPPCSPYPEGTIGYIGPHTDHPHWPYTVHLNLFRVNQKRPPECRCFWNDNKPDAVAPPPQPDWVDLNPYGRRFPQLTP